MRLATVLVPEVGQASGPDLTRYLLVCGALIVGLMALAWAFRRFFSGRLKARASKRSLQVLDVLPLSGKQKLIVVRCYDRSFLLGVGEKEVRSIAELDTESAASEVVGASAPRGAFQDKLEEKLERRLELEPVRAAAEQKAVTPADGPRASGASLGSRDGVLA